jgi:hypothetical protein
VIAGAGARKDQIRSFLNMVPFRGELSGIHAMSRTLVETSQRTRIRSKQQSLFR